MKKRGLSLFIALCLMFSGAIYKIVSLNFSSYAQVDTTYHTKTLTIGETRGNIYDINMLRLVNSCDKMICAAKPGAYALAYASRLESGEKKESLTAQLSNGLPVLFETEEKIQNDDMETFSVPQRYCDGDFLCHIIGYTDISGHGVSGIEKAYDELLTGGSGTLSVTFETDANGRTLRGMIPTVKDNNFDSPCGVILTIDRELQLIAEKAMEECSIENGACVMLSAKDAGIAALVSRPTFDKTDIEGSVGAEGSPFVNKAFSAYAVGSVFKPIIAAAAIENGISTNIGHKCTGQTDIDGTVYGCNRKTAHGDVDMKTALEVSCNTYFVKLTQKLGAQAMYDFCMDMGFSSPTYLCKGMTSASGEFPEVSELKQSGEKANISFGQGGLTATPLQLAAAYLAIANSGYYKYPYLVKGVIDNDASTTLIEKKPDSKIMSSSTCDIIRDALVSTVENGNAYNAECSLCSVAGKTGTAQSGSYDENGKEILRTWFVGFFPANDPLYCVAIMNENGTSGAGDCAPVFSLIAQRTMQLYIDRAN